MTYASLAAQRSSQYRRNQNSVSFASADKAKLGPISSFIIMLVMVCLLAVIYLSQVIKTNQYSYSLDNLNQQKASLETDFSQLQVTAARLQSTDRLENSQVVASLSSPQSVTLVD